jgi:hypothetical protein
MVFNFFVPPNKLSYISSHSPELIFGNSFEGTKTRDSLRNISDHFAFISQILRYDCITLILTC